MFRLRRKLLPVIPRTGGPSQPRLAPPVHPIYTYSTGHAVVVSGLVGAAPLYALSAPLTAALDSAPDDDVDLSQAKSALRVLSALGDGIAGVPWLKGTAGLGLEIVNALDVSTPENQNNLPRILIHRRMYRRTRATAETLLCASANF